MDQNLGSYFTISPNGVSISNRAMAEEITRSDNKVTFETQNNQTITISNNIQSPVITIPGYMIENKIGEKRNSGFTAIDSNGNKIVTGDNNLQISHFGNDEQITLTQANLNTIVSGSIITITDLSNALLSVYSDSHQVSFSSFAGGKIDLKLVSGLRVTDQQQIITMPANLLGLPAPAQPIGNSYSFTDRNIQGLVNVNSGFVSVNNITFWNNKQSPQITVNSESKIVEMTSGAVKLQASIASGGYVVSSTNGPAKNITITDTAPNLSFALSDNILSFSCLAPIVVKIDVVTSTVTFVNGTTNLLTLTANNGLQIAASSNSNNFDITDVTLGKISVKFTNSGTEVTLTDKTNTDPDYPKLTIIDANPNLEIKESGGVLRLTDPLILGHL